MLEFQPQRCYIDSCMFRLGSAICIPAFRSCKHLQALMLIIATPNGNVARNQHSPSPVPFACARPEARRAAPGSGLVGLQSTWAVYGVSRAYRGSQQFRFRTWLNMVCVAQLVSRTEERGGEGVGEAEGGTSHHHEPVRAERQRERQQEGDRERIRIVTVRNRSTKGRRIRARRCRIITLEEAPAEQQE